MADGSASTPRKNPQFVGIRPIFVWPPNGTSLAICGGMSPVGQALQERFGSVCRSELQRLHKKTAALAPEHRAEVHALTLEVAERLAVQLDAALSGSGGELEAVVMRLFAVAAPQVEDK